MENIIISIEETNFKITDSPIEYSGFIIKTNQEEIKIGIENERSCCNEFGYLTSEDDLSDFIGASINNIVIVDKALNIKILHAVKYIDKGCAMFVNIETNKGTLQFVVYNYHDDYYGHDAVLISKQLTVEEVL